MKQLKLLLITILLAGILTACSVEHKGPPKKLFLKCTTQEAPMGPYQNVYAGEEGWEMYKNNEKWTPAGKYQQNKGEFCEVISENR